MSKCIHKCKLDSNKVCLACKRTIEEIIAKGKATHLPEQSLYFIIKESATIHS